jgi:hypothetical protein
MFAFFGRRAHRGNIFNLIPSDFNEIQLFFLWGQQCAVIDASELKDIYAGQNNFVNFIINCHS